MLQMQKLFYLKEMSGMASRKKNIIIGKGGFTYV